MVAAHWIQRIHWFVQTADGSQLLDKQEISLGSRQSKARGVGLLRATGSAAG